MTIRPQKTVFTYPHDKRSTNAHMEWTSRDVYIESVFTLKFTGLLRSGKTCKQGKVREFHVTEKSGNFANKLDLSGQINKNSKEFLKFTVEFSVFLNILLNLLAYYKF